MSPLSLLLYSPDLHHWNYVGLSTPSPEISAFLQVGADISLSCIYNLVSAPADGESKLSLHEINQYILRWAPNPPTVFCPVTEMHFLLQYFL